MKAYTTQARMRETGSAKAWLFQIAYRTFLDEYRKNKRRSELFEGHIEDDAPQTRPGLSSDISKAMDQLPEECRAVVMMVLAYGLTHEEAAKSTGLPLGTVKSHISRGKSKLRTFLAAYEVT